ncbi:uncharacterized protein LOC111015004 isoform X1 [Momordica charantia]|uniref:Uncharacterized protein LOC111015004 isoform X1 n=1 Tax=Momordica charantia TaxID=3673 RepID=A0A6J1CWD7_MOMCH|nr:uncharacterized protein LOC111015004 isoform X1 [Momordica charantia]
MSGNGEQIDLNSDVDLGDREIEADGISLSHPVTDSLIEQRNVESCSRELGKDEAIDVQEKNSSGEGLCRSDEDEADVNVGYEAADGEFLEGRSPDNAKGVEVDAGARSGEESSIAINALSEAEMECSERRHISEKVEDLCGDEIIADEKEVVNAAGTLKTSPSDALFCCEAKGEADSTSEHHSIISVGTELNVESQEEGVFRIQDEEEKVAQNEELAFGSVDVKCDQIVKEDCESHRLLDHGGCVDVLININPEDPFLHMDIDDSGSRHENLGSDDRIQFTDNLSQKVEILTESKELSPEFATDIRTTPLPDCSENQSGKVGGGQTIEDPATSCHILKKEALTDIDEANLFDVFVEVDPHVLMDEEDVSDDVSADSADSVVDFNVYDLVWSKVPSHPWWPGQICDPSASSKKAMKYFKSGRYLIAFFGDHTFAWKEALMIKPFWEYFLELQKQSNLESFHQAIDCALEEFSRRVEFSLACSCLSEELYSELRTQTLTNAGIRKKFSKRVGGDSSLTASSFDPMKLVNIVKEAALSPHGVIDKLELVCAQAQLLAFNRWKGYYELPKFDKSNVDFNDTEHVLVGENDYRSELMEDIAMDTKHDEAADDGKGNLKTQDSSSGKWKHYGAAEDGKGSLSGSTSKKPHGILNKKRRSEDNTGNELNFHGSSHDPAINNPMESAYESGKTKQTFRIGDRIQKVAYKLNESSPILKHDDERSQETVAKTKRNRKPPPNKETSELDSCGKAGNKLTKTRKRRKVSAAPTEASDSEFIKDSYWTDRLIQGIAEDEASFDNQNETVECQIQIPSESVVLVAVEHDAGLLCPGVNSTNQEPPEHVELESENCLEDPYPTALILTFTDFESVPSETNLNNICRKYGPLYESKTEVLKKSKRAKVVFKRTSDAETAFSCTGKYSIFGPSLVSYHLKYLPPPKVSSHSTKRRRRKEV